jgi:formate dehydrogenase subunit beta
MKVTGRQEALTQEARQITRRLLHDDHVIGVVGLRHAHAHTGPHLFTLSDKLEELRLEPRYPLADVCRVILSNDKEGKVGVVVRGCDERALVEMAKLGRVEMERLVLIGLACTEAEARDCNCARPYPSNIHVGKKVDGVAPANDEQVRSLLEKDVEGRLAFWKQEFARCIKCYGCRNVCPVCICDDCVLEEACWVEQGQIPPEWSFHLIRAYHIADKCISCGACAAACPMDIPLTTFYTLVQEKIRTLFDYEPGLDIEQISPLTTTLEEAPLRGL